MGGRYVGIDLHRRRSVIYTMGADGGRLDCVRIANDAFTLLEEVSTAGADAEVVIEATYGWYWVVDLLRDAGFSVHLAHPSGNDWGNRRVKNDERDARDLADLLRLGRLAEAWIAPPALREARELVRYRAKLVQLRSGLKAQVHAVMAREGVLPSVTDMFGPRGQRQLDTMELADAYVVRVESLRDLIGVYDRGVVMLERKIHLLLRATTPATRRSKPSTASGARSPRSSSLRSATSAGSDPRKLCARGRGSRPATASPTPKSLAPRSRSRVRSWCVGLRSRRSSATTAGTGSDTTSIASPSGAGRTKPASRWPANCSRSSTTACATARSAVYASEPRRERSDTTPSELGNGMTPTPVATSTN
jgi:hypothetical protein